ncbi:serine hydrolase domain-containing protein [Maritalea myrionectae]|uniref:serine hydrolase domain-containing protein n=1 Tax=Maritalea myrionectae TaxID=454601 RepID=UPI0003FBDE7A|nr:serine hydrolase domain-containing protein [Maritalea myrionectae]
MLHHTHSKPIIALTLLTLLTQGFFMSAQAQETNRQDIDAKIQTLIDQQLPRIAQEASQFGNSGVVMQDGKIIAQGVFGSRQKDRDNPVASNDKWHLGSITKSMTATAIGRLVDQGKLSFDDTIGDLWPKKADQIDPAWRQVTIAQLLRHLSGAKANFGLGVLFNRTFENQAALDQARDEAVLKIMAKAPTHQPGTTFEYSNIGYTIAGVLAAKVAQMPWERLIEQEVFEPLGLDSAGFGAPKGDNPWGHAKKWMLLTTAIDPEKPESDNSAIMGPAGIAHMSLQDLASYGQMHLAAERGESDYLSAETAKWLHTAPPQVSDDHPLYAAGWIWLSYRDDGGLSLFHNGSNTMWYAFLVNDPKTNASIAFATNVGNNEPSGRGFSELTREVLNLLDQQ